MSLFALTLCFAFSNAQTVVQFQDESILMQDNMDTFEWGQMPNSSRYADGYFGWIQFEQTPTQDIQDRFKSTVEDMATAR